MAYSAQIVGTRTNAESGSWSKWLTASGSDATVSASGLPVAGDVLFFI
jgi:hypothetical protein